MRANKTEPATPVTAAVTLYVPNKELAVNTVEVATPVESGTAVFTPPAKVPEAPLEAGAVNVTVTPVTGLLFESVTKTLSGLEKATPGAAVCGVPLTTVKFAGAPVKLVIVTGPDSAPTLAVI